MVESGVIDNADRFAYGLPKNATDLYNTQLLAYCMGVYKSEDQKIEEFANYFSENFLTFLASDFKLVDSLIRRWLRDMLRERGVFCEKRVGINIADTLARVAQEKPPWHEQNNRHEGASSITGKEAVNNPKSSREFSSDRNKNAASESNTNIFTKEASDRAPDMTTFDNRDNSWNLYNTNSNHT